GTKRLARAGFGLLACCLLTLHMTDSKAEAPGMKNITVSGRTLTIPAGDYDAGGKAVKVLQTASFEIDPGEIIEVRDEALRLGPHPPQGWAQGTKLQGLRTPGINAIGALVPGSLTMRKSPGGPPLAGGKDYIVDDHFGMVGIGPEPSVKPFETVYASYRYGLMRLDTVAVDAAGRASLARGKSDIAVPPPPDVAPGAVRLLNVFVPYRATALTDENVYPILETEAMAKTRSTPGRIPKTMAKIAAGKPVRIVCWGDSVTVGGNSSTPAMKYVEQFRRMLSDKFPHPEINICNISYGGSNSSQWLRLGQFNEEFFKQNPRWPADQIDFQRIIDLKPDLLTIEFVNDAGLDEAGVETVYSDIMNRLAPIGTELILITPHFTRMDVMKVTSMRTPDPRAYVKGLYEFGDRHNVAIADASSRWAHLWKEGLPYETLLQNTINHPDDRGHRIFAEELMRCFE
ncbi:MAG: SGNH/GDSL hydrolase family protein, partial [bacterium]|nr:SGNH/GDSL hydrolase family protein [bacterium]